ncbi:MAG: glycoside hydrolase, partial [Candidatus Methylomirabilis sp.]|nr:glycoside hydrolase [Deltaproteobacteria bacterium]
MPKAYVAFLWHMHQPMYLDGWTGVRNMPWVRLHGTRGYIDMLAALEEFPKVRATINYTPVLIEQLQGYAERAASDAYARIAAMPEEDMGPSERAFALKNFFLANRDAMIEPLPRYRELLVQRGLHADQVDFAKAIDRFSAQDLLDLKVLFRLAWMGFHARETYEELRALADKGRGYEREDLRALDGVERRILADILPRSRALLERGQIDITTTPYCHPILPLLIDTDFGARSNPGAPLPPRYSRPDFARRQLEAARELHRETFGRDPTGFWPSEGSVCPEITPMAKELGFQWCATDEGILFRTLGSEKRRQVIYQPYSVEWGGASLQMFFRDRHISDLIGFSLAQMPAEDAARAFMRHVHEVAASCPRNPPIVPVILDGENPWENYRDGGGPFLRALYRALSEDPEVETITFADYLARHPFAASLSGLHTGSWIDADLHVWVGGSEKNLGWDYLRRTHELAEPRLPQPGVRATLDQEKALRALWAAQGSDWFWWFDETFYSELKEEFDILFRSHLANVFRHLGMETPSFLDQPIHRKLLQRRFFQKQPVQLISPEIDGVETHYYEWVGAVSYLSGELRSHGTMYLEDAVLRRHWLGFDRGALYLRFDIAERHWSPETPTMGLRIEIHGP